MQKTIIYTALSLSVIPNVLVASDPTAEGTPAKIKTTMSRLEQEGRFDGMTPGGEAKTRARVKKDLLRDHSLEAEKEAAEKAKKESAAAFQKISTELDKISISKQQVSAELEKLRADNQRLQTLETTLKAQLDEEKKELSTVQAQLTTDLTTQVAEKQKLELSIQSKTKFIAQLEESYEQTSKKLEQTTKDLRAAEQKHLDELKVLSDKVAGMQSGNKPVAATAAVKPAGSAPKYDPKFAAMTNLGDDS